jgi:DHA1 family bicyclomycin/chloramphenicol resistance-like MFS transporter
MHAADTARPPARTVVVLGLLTMFGPLSLDLYLPALPQLADDLNASASAAQLSITTCLVGLAVGQLVAGPLSDRLGRKRPLMVGLLAYLLASVACALAPSAAVLVVLRLVQGLAGAAGIVISRAIARDLYSGRALMIFFSRLLLIAGLAPVVAPILGGQLSTIMSWRGIFGVLAGFGAVLLLAGWLGLKETLPPERRIVGGFAAPCTATTPWSTTVSSSAARCRPAWPAPRCLPTSRARRSSCNGSTACRRRASHSYSDASLSAW